MDYNFRDKGCRANLYSIMRRKSCTSVMCTLAEDIDFLFLRKRSLEEYKNVGREVSQRKVNYLLKSVRVLGLNPTGISEEYIDYTQSHHYQEYGMASFYL